MSEIIQRVVEKIEIQGDERASAALNKVGDSAAGSNKIFDDFIMTIAEMNDRMSTATAAFEAASKKIDEAGEKSDDAGKKGSSGMRKFFNSMFKANLAALLVDRGIGLVIGKLTGLARMGWGSAKAIDQMTGDVQGLTLALFDLGKGDPLEHFERSGRIAEATMSRLERIAFRASTPISEIGSGFSEASTHLAPLGYSMDRILGLVEKNAAAAKVLGDDGQASMLAITNAISSGTLAGKKGLPAALKAMVGDLSKLKADKRIQKIEEALTKLGAPLDRVSQGPAEGFERMEIVAQRILGRVVLPLYDRIGSALGRMAGWLDEQDGWWKKLAADSEDFIYSVSMLADGVWSGATAAFSLLSRFNDIEEKLGTIWTIGRGFFDIVELIGLGWKAAGETIEVLANPERGMGKLYTYSEAISLKWSEIMDKILKVAEKMANIAVPDFLKRKVPGIGNFFEGFRKMNEARAKERERQGQRLAKMEAREGLDPLTSETRRLRRAALADAEGLLKGLKGAKVKVEQNIGKIEIVQDFRNQDPDRVLVEFVAGLERLGESALQSTVGGQATVFEGGQ